MTLEPTMTKVFKIETQTKPASTLLPIKHAIDNAVVLKSEESQSDMEVDSEPAKNENFQMEAQDYVTPILKETICSTELRTVERVEFSTEKGISKAMEHSLMVASPQIPFAQELQKEFQTQKESFSVARNHEIPAPDSKLDEEEEEKDDERLKTIDSDDHPEKAIEQTFYFSEDDQKALKQQFINRLLEMTRLEQNKQRLVL